MRFLADESCDFAVVRALRAAGYDVGTVSDLTPGAEDHIVAALAASESRVLLTEDKDFGQLAYATGHSTSGVVLIRYPARARSALAAAIVAVVAEFGDRLVGRSSLSNPGEHGWVARSELATNRNNLPVIRQSNLRRSTFAAQTRAD